MRPYENGIVLSRRNLLALLAKVEGAPEDSEGTIYYHDPGHPQHGFRVEVEADDVHYAHPSRRGYGPGRMHPATEAALREGARVIGMGDLVDPDAGDTLGHDLRPGDLIISDVRPCSQGCVDGRGCDCGRVA